MEWKPPACRKERRYKNRYEPGRGSEKRGGGGGAEQKGGKYRNERIKEDRATGVAARGEGVSGKRVEGAECMEIRSHAIQL